MDRRTSQNAKPLAVALDVSRRCETVSGWSYRLVRFVDVDGPILKLCECYFREDGTPANFDTTPFLMGNTPDDIGCWLREMAKCLDLPAIDATEFKGNGDC